VGARRARSARSEERERPHGQANGPGPFACTSITVARLQNIPMNFVWPGVGAKDSNWQIRHVDVASPTILESMGIDYRPADLNGEAVKLPKP
jgi:hypothetical protein